MHKIKTQHFEGPLDLLLQLIEDNKLDITQLSLAHVTEQYIEILYQAKDQITINELADFLFIAAKLLVIKSKALLPYLTQDQEDESQMLERQLKMYKEYYLASKKILHLIARRNFCYSKEKFLVSHEVGFQPPKNLQVSKLKALFQEIITGLEPIVRMPKGIIRRTINIAERINLLRNMIYERITLNFQTIIQQAKDKTDLIVSFLALLELTKQKVIIVRQEKIFEEIIIEKV